MEFKLGCLHSISSNLIGWNVCHLIRQFINVLDRPKYSGVKAFRFTLVTKNLKRFKCIRPFYELRTDQQEYKLHLFSCDIVMSQIIQNIMELRPSDLHSQWTIGWISNLVQCISVSSKLVGWKVWHLFRHCSDVTDLLNILELRPSDLPSKRSIGSESSMECIGWAQNTSKGKLGKMWNQNENNIYNFHINLKKIHQKLLCNFVR